MTSEHKTSNYKKCLHGKQITSKEIPMRTRVDLGTAVKEFMDSQIFPDWFRGMSKFQMDAADSLINCIRDDNVQGTSHRVRDALIRLGLNPLVSGSGIKHSMYLSRGNDIAFLWFLMELYYRNACDKCENGMSRYTVNEQLIMSAIAHLDTIPTLRELDKLLPKQPPKPKMENLRRKRKAILTYNQPYFKKQQRPVLYGKSLALQEASKVANFGYYDKYLNPNFVVPNESSRWFAEIELCKKKQIEEKADDIEAVFKHKDGAIECHQQNEVYDLSIEAMHESMDQELEVAKENAFEKNFHLNERIKEQSNKRTPLEQLIKENIKECPKILSKITLLIKKPVPDTNTTKETADSVENQRVLIRSIPSRSRPTLTDGYFKKYDFGHAVPSTVKNKYFQAPTCHTPYKFNYNKIFDLGFKNQINKAIGSALNASSSCEMSIHHTNAIRKCCKDIWTYEVKKYNVQNEKDRQKEVLPPDELCLGYNLPYYDPRNVELMQSMLYNAIQEMKKNKKFVLASFPDAHQLPILKEWIKKRYGMVYTKREEKIAYQLSKKVFHMLKKNEIRIRMPQLQDLTSKREITYACKKHLHKRIDYLRDRYHHSFNASLLEDTRICWGAVRPYHISSMDPFFAYLPARENNIHMFRPWKVGENIRAKEQWDRRQRQKRSNITN